MHPLSKTSLSRTSVLAGESLWFLAGQIDESGIVRHLPIHTTPFRIGRRRDVSLCLPYPTVSSLHAEIVEHSGRLLVKDLGSTNGTYLNGLKVKDTATLKQDDLLQFADVTFRLRRQTAHAGTHTVQEDVSDRALALVQFDKLMAERAVVPFFQPIMRLEGPEAIAYEVLGRSRLFGLETPKAMFSAAGQLNLEVELSRMFRWEALQATTALPRPPHLYLNTHPLELVEPGLLESMESLRKLRPGQALTLEIHEGAVTRAEAMRELRERLRDWNIGLAYDDFGAGQARFIELVEVRPDVLKFDMELVQGIHSASAERQNLVATLVRMARELDIVPLAEGVELPEESETCRQLGFELAQGFYFGKPAPLSP